MVETPSVGVDGTTNAELALGAPSDGHGVFCFSSVLLPLLLVLAIPLPAVEQEQIDRGLAALVKLQAPDGTVGDGGNSMGPTALFGMALLSGGHTPTRGLYREASARCLKAVIAHQDPVTGYLGQADAGRMYAHGFATLYLAECAGMAPDQPVRRALEAAVDLIHRSQNHEGGWRYDPVPDQADISVTICEVMALRAANNVGVGGQATQEAIGRAVAYVRSCANGDGSFSYQAAGGGGWGTNGPEGIPRAAAGSMALMGSGIADAGDKTLGPALRFLRKNFIAHLGGAAGENYFWYGQYYTAQAMFHSPDPEDWNRYWSVAAPAIAKRQEPSGVWLKGEAQSGPAYNTAMALIILQIPNNYLPIFQR